MICRIACEDKSLGIGLEHGVDGIILRITDENGAGAAAGVVDGDVLESVNGVDVRTLEYDKQLQRVVEAKGKGMVEVGVQRLAGGITETSLDNNNDGGDGALNRTRSYMVANPKASIFPGSRLFSRYFLKKASVVKKKSLLPMKGLHIDLLVASTVTLEMHVLVPVCSARCMPR